MATSDRNWYLCCADSLTFSLPDTLTSSQGQPVSGEGQQRPRIVQAFSPLSHQTVISSQRIITHTHTHTHPTHSKPPPNEKGNDLVTWWDCDDLELFIFVLSQAGHTRTSSSMLTDPAGFSDWLELPFTRAMRASHQSLFCMFTNRFTSTLALGFSCEIETYILTVVRADLVFGIWMVLR